MARSLTPEILLAPLDDARAAVLRAFGPLVGPWAARRDMRVAILGTTVVVTALLGALLAPLWLLALGPIILGVPHLVADVRYLVARPGLHRRGRASIALLLPLAAAGIASDLRLGAVGVAAALVVSRGAPGRKIAGAAIAAPLVAAAFLWTGWAELVLAHAHNFIAVALWWAWRPRSSRLSVVPLALFAAVTVAMMSGALDPILRGAITLLPPIGPSLKSHVRQLAPLAPGDVGLRLVILFAFAQAVHYGVWLRLIPEDDRDRTAPRGFASSYRALVGDLGVPIVAMAGLLALGLAVWATIDLVAARSGYLRFAVFHGQLELVAAALLFTEGRSRDPIASAPTRLDPDTAR